MGSLNNVLFFLKLDDREKLNKRKKYNNCSAEIFMQMDYFATEVNSLSVYLPSQYGYPNEINFAVNKLHKREELREKSVAISNCKEKQWTLIIFTELQTGKN